MVIAICVYNCLQKQHRRTTQFFLIYTRLIDRQSSCQSHMYSTWAKRLKLSNFFSLTLLIISRVTYVEHRERILHIYCSIAQLIACQALIQSSRQIYPVIYSHLNKILSKFAAQTFESLYLS